MLLPIVVVLLCLLCAFLFIFAVLMDKFHGAVLLAVLAVWIVNMQPANAAGIKTITDIDGVRYYDVMTTNPNESYNGVQGRDPRIDKLRNWLDLQCRGGHGDDADTQAFCTLRDRLN